MTVSEREQRRKLRRLMKSVAFVPAHKRDLAIALADLASRSSGVEERRALERIERLVVEAPTQSSTANTQIASVLRDIEGGQCGSNAGKDHRPVSSYHDPSTPPGHTDTEQKPPRNIIYSPPHEQVSNERLPCKPLPWTTSEQLAESLAEYMRKYKDVMTMLTHPWENLSSKERKPWKLVAGELWKELDDVWPKELPTRRPLVPPGNVVCAGCDGTGTIPRSLKIALEWFLARRAKKTKLNGRYRIEAHDWGYDEIAAVELCSHYRENRSALIEVVLEHGGPQLFQDQKPTKLHPCSIRIDRYPTSKQMERGALEIREKHKKMSGMHRMQLKKIKKERMIRGPELKKNKRGEWECDWAGKGVGCSITHLSSGLTERCDRFTNFKQNMHKAEIELEKSVAAWFEQGNPDPVLRETSEISEKSEITM